jgi:hypothetical protein
MSVSVSVGVRECAKACKRMHVPVWICGCLCVRVCVHVVAFVRECMVGALVVLLGQVHAAFEARREDALAAAARVDLRLEHNLLHLCPTSPVQREGERERERQTDRHRHTQTHTHERARVRGRRGEGPH